MVKMLNLTTWAKVFLMVGYAWKQEGALAVEDDLFTFGGFDLTRIQPRRDVVAKTIQDVGEIQDSSWIEGFLPKRWVQMAPDITKSGGEKEKNCSTFEGEAHPVVLMHGLGDNAQSQRMQSIRRDAYVVNVQIGSNAAEDTKNSFFMTMDEQTEYFARAVMQDKRLKNGFNALGYSQGNLIIRAYIERYNNPPVLNFLSVHGPMAGVGALPRCEPTQFTCKSINQLIGVAVYKKTVQNNLAQANYFRDPTSINSYLDNALFLPDINNERSTKNATYKANFLKLRKLILVKAAKDTTVYPRESEWFGAYQDNSRSLVLLMNATTWYKEDSFGLRSLHSEGKIVFKTTPENHLQVSREDFMSWIDEFFRPDARPSMKKM